MLGKTKTNKPGTGFSVLKQGEPPEPRYPKPKILLIDITDDTEAVLKAAGYDVSQGSFGAPYRVEKKDGYLPVIPNHELPSCDEKEIVIIDLSPSRVLPGPVGDKVVSEGENDWWAKCSHGWIDPRPRAMVSMKSVFDRILIHGGIFIVFAQPRMNQDVIFGKVQPYHGLQTESEVPFDNWSFLSALNPNSLQVNEDTGSEIHVEISKGQLGKILHRDLRGAEFLCNLSWSHFMKPNAALAINKFKSVVGTILLPDEYRKGLVIILPELKQKAKLILGLVTEVLPEVVPLLFPYNEAGKWIHRELYEIPRILEIRNQIEAVKADAEARVQDLEKQIESEREYSGFLHDLIRGTDTTLAKAVEQTLIILGFKKIVNVDAVKEAKGDPIKDEDLWIDDKSPLVLVEVKGINGTPEDDEALQVQKYIAPRMKELKRTDIKGLSIVNHQRHIPPLERDNTNLFRKLILDNADKQDIGLLTTWDLFRLARGYTRNNWTHGQIQDLFYRSGRIEPIPTHYHFIGVIDEFFPKASALILKLENEDLKIGDRVAFELPVAFLEESIESIRTDDQPVAKASKGTIIGIKTELTKDQAKKGVKVYLIKEDAK